jgi:TolB-like protein/Tfp pilus assembly protein PilF
MSSIIEGYNYDIFISYRQKDNKGDRWVSEFVDSLKTELESTFKEEISVYFDINPHDGLLETHDVDESLKEKLKCLVFIPIISRTYCDPKSFAWEHEFKAFVELASKDQFGLKVRLPNGNVASRVLPVSIHDLDNADIKVCESLLGGALRGVDFIYKSPGVNRPLRSNEDHPQDNFNKTYYRDQINKVANSIKEIFSGLKGEQLESIGEQKEVVSTIEESTLKEKSIIVLPFENMSSDPEQEYFSDGLTEEIITDLSHIHDLLVISRSSAMTFKRTKSTIKEITDKVNVRYVLEGSVRKAGNNLRITAQLIDGINDSHIWAEKYSGTLDDIFDIQEKVSQSIADSLKIRLSSAQKASFEKPKISNSAAYEQYLIARKEIWLCTKESLSHAIQLLNNSLNSIGRNEYLLVALGTAYFQFVNVGIDPDIKFLDKADELVDEAIELNPSLSKAHYLKSIIYETRGKLRESFNSVKRALNLDPADSEAMMMIAFMYVMIGKPEKAKPYAKKAIVIDPLNPLMYFGDYWVSLSEGKFDEALDTSYKMYNFDRDNLIYIHNYACTLSIINRIREATELFDLLINTYPNQFLTKIGKALRYAINNQKQDALEAITEDLKKAAEMDHLIAWELAGIYSLIGEKNEAIDLLERATKDIFINYPFFSKIDPFLENIRGEERFKKLMERVKYEWENFEV